MAKLAMARVKRADELPDYTKCCDTPVVRGDTQFVIDLSKTRATREGQCSCVHCGTTMPAQLQVWATGETDGVEGWADIDLLDIDEAPHIQAEGR